MSLRNRGSEDQAQPEAPAPGFSFVSDDGEKQAPEPAARDEEEREIAFSFESENVDPNVPLDGFAPRQRDSDSQDRLEEFSLSTAARDLREALSSADIPPQAYAIGAVAVVGFIYVVAVLLFS